VLTEGRYARHVEFVVEKLKDAHALVEERMDALGVELFRRPRAGLFVWGALPIDPADGSAVATRALQHGIWLAPGSYFRPDDAESACFRFNVPYSLDDALWTFLDKAIKGF